MGAGSKFDSKISTRGGRSNFVTAEDINSGDSLAKDIIKDMEADDIKFTKDNIVFAARLENGVKIFLEEPRIDHIVSRHSGDFKRTFGVSSKDQIKAILTETISKGKLISSKTKELAGLTNYSNKYYYKGRYCVVYCIAENGYITTAYPKSHGGK